MKDMNEYREFLAALQSEGIAALPTALTEKYDVLDMLAQREGRSVYLAEERATRSQCVVKAVTGDSPDSAQREYETLRALDHPGIPRALDFYAQDGLSCLVREYTEGKTLDVLVKENGLFDERTVLETAGALCDILAYLHRQTPPIIYRDIKPQNIVRGPDGALTLIDFGIARAFDREKPFDTVFLGSVDFAPPEQFGFTHTDLRSDVFAAGKLMLYLRMGNADIRSYTENAPDSRLKRIILKCVQLSPEKRYKSVTRLRKAIDAALHPYTARHVLAGIAACCAVLAVGAGIWCFTRPAHAPEEAPVVLPQTAEGLEADALVLVPVDFTVLFDGKPFADCAVAVDNHHWYAPAADGKAVLEALPSDIARSRAAHQNRTAIAETPIAPGSPVSVTLDIGKTPEVEEALSIALAQGEDSRFPLPIADAAEVTLSGQPNGVTIERDEEGFALAVSGEIAENQRYTFTLVAENEYGSAFSVVDLLLEREISPQHIADAAGLNRVRDNLAGHYILDADIDLGDFDNWQPIGNPQRPFTGTIDGNGHVITGLRILQDAPQSGVSGSQHFGLIGYARGATIRNIVLREPSVWVSQVDICAIGGIVGVLENSLLERCAVFGGRIATVVGTDSSVGGLVGLNNGLIRASANTAAVENRDPSGKQNDSYAGGLCGMMGGFVLDSANAGEVHNVSLAGGVAGFNDGGVLTRSYNAGKVAGIPYVGEYLPGGIVQMLGAGRIVSYCCFAEDTAEFGATVFNGGTLLDIRPVARESLRDAAALSNLGDFGENGAWDWASADIAGPLPSGIFSSRAEAPLLPENGTAIDLPARENVLYYYTLDGSDPRGADAQGVEELRIGLEKGQTIRVFSAERGKYDSATAQYTA